MQYEIISLAQHPHWAEPAAVWFHEKWGIPLEAYRESICRCLAGESIIPQWYVAVGNTGILGGLGVIENDFHNRPDLTPNVCAVYVEEEQRRQGIAGALLHYACQDLAEKGIGVLYLLTDHDGFYERYGWEFLCMVQGDGEQDLSRMYVHRQTE